MLKEKIPANWGLSEDEIIKIFEEEQKQSNKLRNAQASERKKIYAEAYNEYFSNLPFHPQFKLKNNAAAAKSRIEHQVHILKPFASQTKVFMEIGAGDCSLSLAMAKDFKKIYPMEVSDEITAGIHFPENIELIIFDGFDMPLESDSVDIAFSNQLMEHLHPDDALEQIRSIHRVLKKGGKYICITPNGINGPHDISRFFGNELKGFHLKEYTASELRALFLSIGFSDCKAFIILKGKKVNLPWFIVRWVENHLQAKSRDERKEILNGRFIRRIFDCIVYAEK
jgi:SAM-dependent methyltransferase